jgi:DNA adenine methylase
MKSRPLVRYHGGKWILAPWIIAHFPPHRCYVEPFGGGGSVLLRKPRCYAEVYNDLGGEIVNLFKVARERGEELARLVELTPFARAEFAESYERVDDQLEQARRTLVRSFMGFGSNSLHQKSGFRANSNRSGTTPAHDWMNYPDALRVTIQRLRGVVIENRDALACMLHHDTPETLHYCDPPYVLSTRSDDKADYQHEMSDEQHEKFAIELKKLKGMVIVSGYRSDHYDTLFKGWRRVDKAHHADGAAKRVESLWLSPNMPAPGLELEAANA